MTERTQIWEAYRHAITPDHPHYVECAPDLYVPELLDLTPEALLGLDIEHIFMDFDGTIAANGNLPPMSDEMLAYLQALSTDSRFASFSIATNSMSNEMGRIAASIGPHVNLFQPVETPNGPIFKHHPGFYRRVLFETDIWDTPELGVMIGDSHRYDINAASDAGLKTVLVDRLSKRLARHALTLRDEC